MLGSAFETIMDPDVSGWEKFLTILTTLSMIIPTVVSIYKTFKQLLSAETVAKLANVAATIAQVGAEKALNQEKGQSRTTTK
jgi:NADH:ubiquinone oxidoreductase subunit 2 (subunit N)